MKASSLELMTASASGQQPEPVDLAALGVRPALPEELGRVAKLLDDEHYLGRGHPVGRELVQVVHEGERWAAVLVWGPPAMKLTDRDQWVGWTHRQRAERLGLIVQNRRFLVIAEARTHNLASRALGLAVRHLPGQWETAHGYRPLLAETFTDIEAFEGICYKAAGWVPCGESRGFGRHRADYYRQHQRPKKLWIKPLKPDASELLCGPDLPPPHDAGCNPQTPESALALSKAHIDSLRDALRKVPDPRSSNRSWPLSVLLTTVCIGLLSGRKSLAAIHRYARQLNHQQRTWLGFLPQRGGQPGRRSPSYQSLYNLLGKLEPGVLANALASWLAAYEGTLPRALAIDGKYVRDLLLTLALSEHENGAPVAVAIASKQPKSEESKTEGEITAAKRLYRNTDLQGATVTGDALHCERECMQLVMEGGGDFLFQLKGNQPTALDNAQKTSAATPPLFSSETTEAGHGRIETRRYEVRPIEPMNFGLPHVRGLVTVHRRVVSKRSGRTEESSSHYASSLPPRKAQHFANLIRGHWGGSESRNHWVRDALFEEDRTRSKNLNLNGNLATLRCALIALKSRLAPQLSWPELMEQSSLNPSIPIRMVQRHSFK